MNKTSITTLYLYAFLLTLSAWLCDVTFTADRSCTLVGCGTSPMAISYWSQTTQPTRSGAVTAVWQTLCKLCRPLPPPAMGPAGWLALLLVKAGDVETNPGSTTTR